MKPFHSGKEELPHEDIGATLFSDGSLNSKKKERNEKGMKKKNWETRMISGLLCAVMVLSSAAASVPASENLSGEELKAYVGSLPDLEQVKDSLDADEIVTAMDLEIDFDADFDPAEDFINLEIPDEDKVNVNFYEAGNSDQEDFSTGKAGTYKAVYYVEPTNEEHPAYRIRQNITVKEPVTEAQTTDEANEGSGKDASDDESEDADEDPVTDTTPAVESAAPETEDPETTEAEETMPEDIPESIISETEEAEETEAPAAEEETETPAETAESESVEIREETSEPEEETEASRTPEETEVPGGTAESEAAVVAEEIPETEEETETSPAEEETEIPAGTFESEAAEVTEEASEPEEETEAMQAAEETEAPVETAEPEAAESSEETSEAEEETAAAEIAGPETAPAQEAVPASVEETAESIIEIRAYPADIKEVHIDGIVITVEAPEGAFPEGWTVKAEKVSKKKTKNITEAIDEKFNENVNKAASYTFDIRILDAAGNEIQPENGKQVKVSFAMKEVESAGNLDVNVYHIKDGEQGIDKLKTSIEEDAVTVTTDGFSWYTVEFTYNELLYVLSGGQNIALSDILSRVGLAGSASDVSVSNPDLFYPYQDKNGTWFIQSVSAFHTKEWMKVTIDDIIYEITVTDATTFTPDYTTSAVITKEAWVGFGNLGDGSTIRLHVEFTDSKGRSVNQDGYCVEPHWYAPDGTYSNVGVKELKDNKNLAKVVYYGTESLSGDDCFFKQSGNTGYTASEQFGIVHWSAAKIYGSDEWSYLSNSAGRSAVEALIDYAESMPSVPDAEISFSKTSVTASVPSGADYQKTPSITFNADEGNSITITLPKYVTYHDETNGTESAQSNGSTKVTIAAGTKFYFTAPLKYSGSMDDEWTVNAKGTYTKDLQAYLLDAGDETQPVAVVEGFKGERTASFTVTWLKTAKLTVVKTDAAGNRKLSGAVFGVYSDKACSDLIVKMPATDEKGSSAVELDVTGTVYLKELTPPKGYRITVESEGVKVSAGETTTKTVPNEEIRGELKVYKQGPVLTGAVSDADGTTFRYETAKLANATYSVTAGEDITDAAGTVVYKNGAIVAVLKTNADGKAVLTDLPFGTYVITETGAPVNFVNKGESKTVTLKEGSTGAEITAGTATFENDRQRVEVTAIKQDKLTSTAISGAQYGLYADADITNNAGNVIVKKDALIGKVTTGSDGSGKFAADLPIGFTFYIKELAAPAGYRLNDSDIYRFTTTYTNDRQEKITFSHIFENEEIRGRLTIFKEGEVLTGADVTDTGITFRYEVRKQKGATFAVYAGADIKTAGGRVVYKKGDLVKDGLVTGDDGSVSLDNLFLGTYTVKETGAPKNFVLNGESKDITLSPANPSGEVVLGSVTIKNERQKVEVTAIKQDKLTSEVISGAQYGLYADADITNNAGNVIVKKDALIGKVTTGSDGSGKFATDLPIGFSFYLKELAAPAGYKLNGSDIYRFTTTYTNDRQEKITFSHTFENEEIRGKLTIFKEGEVLAGADVTDAGTTFKYEVRKQKGAAFTVYAGADIKTAGGRVIYKKGDLVKDGLVTGDDGSVSLDNLFLGTYTVKETGAPKNFVLNGESKDITLSQANLSGEVVLGSVTIKNSRQKAKVTVVKQDDTTKNPLAGGIYGLYAGADIRSADGETVVKKDTFIEKVTTGTDGSAVFKSDLPLNSSYYVKEIQAPENYYRNQKDAFPFTFSYTDEKQAEVSFSHTFANERVNARIELIKVDAETGEPQGDAKLGRASYGLYAREDILHPDGKTGVIYKAGAQVATLSTDNDGKAFIEGLYLGKYFLKELIPSEGYLLDPKEYDLDCACEGDLMKTVKKTAASNEQVIRQPFQVIKAANNGKTDADLLKGVGFSAYLISSLPLMEDGSYDFREARPIVLTAEGGKEMFTDEKGHAVSIPIPYGRYIVRETTTPHNFTPVGDFEVTISENHPNEPQQWHVLLDDEYEAKLKIIKKDDETKKPVLLPKTEFKVYDLDRKQYVEQVTTYPSVITHKSYFTDENGYLILPDNLMTGHYRIEEVNAPYGYILNHNTFEVLVDSDTASLMDPVSGDAVIEVVIENRPVKGKLTITKKGEVLSSFGKNFGYKEISLAGAEFAVYAAEDIYTPDYQRDADGNRIMIYAKDTLVATVITDESGTAFVEDLPLGSYRVEETKAPLGFVLNTKPQTVTFEYADQETPVIGQTVKFTNDRQRVEISVEKQDAETGRKLPGAVFGLYTKSAIISADHGKVLAEADTLLEEVTSGADGRAVFTKDLPLGQYYVKEHKAPAGYVSSDEILNYDAAYQGQDVPVVKLMALKKNMPTTFEFTKSDITTGTELDGAVLTILTRKGKVIERWTSVKNQPHAVKGLTAGESYVLREEFAPYGYIRAADVVFRVEDTAEIQKVEMKDEVPAALLIISKKGEFLDKVSLLDNAKGTVEHLFEYISGNLTPVTFEVYAAEDIRAADGNAPDYYKKDDLVGTITTDDVGIAKLGGLPVGKYYVLEKETAYGYVLDNTPRFVDLSYRDQDTPIVVYDRKWQNARQKVSLHLVKKEKGIGSPLKGAVFGLYTAEDIKSGEGKTLIKKDTLIEQKTTDVYGEIAFTADLPIDGKYYVTEIQSPDGYLNAGEKQEFTFTYGGSDKDILSYDFTFENEPTTVELSKTDITNGRELPGAHLRVIDENMNVIDEWVSEEKPHIIQKLVVGREYKLIETKPADGYVTAESVTFKIENNGEVRKVKMEDDVTRVRLSKSDITTGKEVPGAKLAILDEAGKVVLTWTSTEEAYYIEKLPIGKYTLREEIAPAGYLSAEDVFFIVTDTGVEQKVEMKDDYTKVEITKSDITDGKTVIGAKLAILDKDGKEVESWVTEEKPHYIEKLPVGEYTLREVTAPDGYLKAEDVKFTVEETGEIQKVAMKDDYTRVEISKQDITNSKEIPGAKLTVFDKDGKEVESWVSGEKPHYIEKLPAGEYTLRELSAPDGYEVAEDVKFTVEETGEIQTVVMKDAPKKQPETPATENTTNPATPTTGKDTPKETLTTPKTGDDRNPLIWLLLLGIGGCLACAVWYIRKKDDKDQNQD